MPTPFLFRMSLNLVNAKRAAANLSNLNTSTSSKACCAESPIIRVKPGRPSSTPLSTYSPTTASPRPAANARQTLSCAEIYSSVAL
jgi:hypothetical protein